MSKNASRLIALLVLLWLPFSSSSALAASIAMQLQSGKCHEPTLMLQHDINESQMLRHGNQTANTDFSTSCAACGACLLACVDFVVFQSNIKPLITTTKRILTFTPDTFISHVSAPLLPPPLARV